MLEEKFTKGPIVPSAKLGYQRTGAVKYQGGQQEVQEKLTEESRNIDFVEVFKKTILSFWLPPLMKQQLLKHFLMERI